MFSRVLRAARVAVPRAVRAHHDDAMASAAVPAVRVRQRAPDFDTDAVLADGTLGTLSLGELLKGSNYLVLAFYPLDHTFVCPTELTAFSDRAADFEAAGASVAVISVDSAYSHLAWTNVPRQKGGLGKMAIPMLADVNKSISRAYGVLVEDPDDELDGVALRGTVIVDPDGIVRAVSINDAPIGRSVDEVLRLVQAVKHTDEHGDVCPAGWTPGKPTMQADPEGSQAYFSTLK